MSIHEPATLLTDCFLAVLAGFLGWRLGRARPSAIRAVRWWMHALWLTALSALVGGCYHGLAPNFPATAPAWWIITLLLICLLSAAMGMSLVHEVTREGRASRWRWLIAAKLGLFAGIILVKPVFAVAITDYGLIMLGWAVAALLLRRPWSGWMLAAVALSALGALVQQMQLSPAPRFNHNDLFHVIQAFAIYGFYRAGFGLESSGS